MTFIQEAFDSAQRYLVERNPDDLKEAIRVLQNEIDTPTLQEPTILVKHPVAHIDMLVRTKNSVKLSGEEYTFQDRRVPLEEDKLIRLVASDQPEASVLILRVVMFNAETRDIILAPVS